jgi:AcrR family transcriptional regulator
VSEIPQATVYRLFSSKKGILKALLDVSVAGGDELVPIAHRSHVRSLLDATPLRSSTTCWSSTCVVSRAVRAMARRSARRPTAPLGSRHPYPRHSSDPVKVQVVAAIAVSGVWVAVR